MYYVGGAGLVLLLGQTCAGLTWFTQQKLRLGVDIFQIALEDIPAIDDNPFLFLAAQAWVSNTQEGLMAFSIECPHESWNIHWISLEKRYECPVCGTWFHLDGTLIFGPSKRGLDRFTVTVTSPDGRSMTSSDGSPISIANAQSVVIDTRTKIPGVPRP